VNTSKGTDTCIEMWWQGDRCRGVGADRWSDKRYSHRVEFSETCLECRENVREFYFGGSAGTLFNSFHYWL